MQTRKTSSQQISSQFKVVAIIVAILWLLEIVDWISGNRLDSFGIRPRNINGLNGILFAPWLHFGFAHLAANTIPFAVLAWFSMLNGMKRFAAVTFIITLGGGIGTWLLGTRGSLHAGASILIFGYFGYLLVSAMLERSLKAVSLALIVILLYGSMIWGIFPFLAVPGVSWQGHFSGFLAGVLAAWLFSRQAKKDGADSAESPEEPFEINILG